MVLHSDDVHLVITTFELKANKSRDRVSILGKVPVLAKPSVGTSGQVPLEQSLFPSREWPGNVAAMISCTGWLNA